MSKSVVVFKGVEKVVEARDEILSVYERIFSNFTELERLEKSIPAVSYPLPDITQLARHLNSMPQKLELARNIVRSHLDKKIWRHIIEISGMNDLMGAEDKAAFFRSLEDDPPKVTMETIRATGDLWHASADQTFRKGLVDLFKILEGKYKTNDAFKISKKIILEYAVQKSGNTTSWRSSTSARDQVDDLDRILHVLDGIPASVDKNGVEYQRQTASYCCENQWADEGRAVLSYFNIKAFQNGNIHVTFTRPDLILKANKIIAGYFGEAIADASRA